MPTALFVGFPAHGHTNPSLPLVQALVARGQRVIYYSSRAYEPAITGAGATFRAYESPWMDTLVAGMTDVQRLSWLLTRTTADVLDRDFASAQAERPDYVVSDSVAIWGQWMAARLGVPCAHSVPTFAFSRKVMSYAARHGVRPKSVRLAWTKISHVARAAWLAKQLKRRYGAGPTFVSAMLGQAPLNVVHTSVYFQPCAETFDDRYLFVGPTLEARRESPEFPWDRVPAGPLVYVSLGTLFNADLSFYRACFDAFRSEPFSVVMSIGRNISQAELGTPPPNVVIFESVPQMAVLARAQAFVTHGGMNSATEGLFHGVPLVVVPQMGEQALVAGRVEELGAGICLVPHAVTADLSLIHI